ncbi:hypothetical protein FRB98_008062 [Tulasnella sp. 332]|nr:hypothetical protein FRB98_008062 [Tulasnella sp. 332]
MKANLEPSSFTLNSAIMNVDTYDLENGPNEPVPPNDNDNVGWNSDRVQETSSHIAAGVHDEYTMGPFDYEGHPHLWKTVATSEESTKNEEHPRATPKNTPNDNAPNDGEKPLWNDVHEYMRHFHHGW